MWIPRVTGRVSGVAACFLTPSSRALSRVKTIVSLVKCIASVRTRISRETIAIVTMAIRFVSVAIRFRIDAIRFVLVAIRFRTSAIRVASVAIRFASRAIRFSPGAIRSSSVAIRLATPAIRFANGAILFSPGVIRLTSGAIRFSPGAGASPSLAIRFSSLAIRFSSGYKGPMTYTMADLEQATGVTARTIRQYIALGFLEPPKRKGLGAVYPESTYVKAIAITRMRGQNVDWATIGARMRNWPLARVREFVASTDPKPPEAPAAEPPEVPAPVSAPALEGEPVTPPPRLPHAGAAPREDLEARGGPTDDEWLPEGPRWVLAPLLPGLAIWIREDATPIVRRTAAEIVRRYGSP